MQELSRISGMASFQITSGTPNFVVTVTILTVFPRSELVLPLENTAVSRTEGDSIRFQSPSVAALECYRL